MLFSSPLSVAVQATLLREFLGAKALRLTAERAEELLRPLNGSPAPQAARQLCASLKAEHINLKHMEALALLGRLLGQPHVYVKTTSDEGHRYRLMVVSLASIASADIDEYSSDPAALLDRACEQIRLHGAHGALPSVATLRRGEREVHLTCWGANPNGLILFLQAPPGIDYSGWNMFADRACERIRRALEHEQNCFCDGYAIAQDPEAKRLGITALTVNVDGLQIARGNELLVFTEIEKYLGHPFTSAKPELNTLDVDGKRFYLGVERIALEPLLEHTIRTLFHPETEQLFRRYRHFHRRLGKPISQCNVAEFSEAQSYGVPETIPVNWQVLEQKLKERGSSISTLERQLEGEGSVVREAFEQRKAHLHAVPFIRLAQALELADYNELVLQPSMKSAIVASDEPALRALLDAADELRVIMSRSLPDEYRARLKEAAEELIGSRKVRSLNRARMVDPPIDDAMFSVDAGEFLSVAEDSGALTLAAFVPLFLHMPRLSLPALGRKLALFVVPETPRSEILREAS